MWTSCFIYSNNQTFCWGVNYGGGLGSGGDNYTTMPLPFNILPGAIPNGVYLRQLTSGGYHTCAIASNKQIYCWGYNYYGQLGNGVFFTDSRQPVQTLSGQIPAGVYPQSITSNVEHTCALASNNQAYCWGHNEYGELGNGTTSNANVPMIVAQGAIPLGVHLTQINAGRDHTCALASNNQAYCWGRNQYGQLGNGTMNNSYVPTPIAQGLIPQGVYLTQIQAADYYTCALASNNQIYCWGQNSAGNLGNGDSANRHVPTPTRLGAIPPGVMLKQLSASFSHACVVTVNNQAYCWGNNSYSNLGNGNGVYLGGIIVHNLRKSYKALSRLELGLCRSKQEVDIRVH